MSEQRLLGGRDWEPWGRRGLIPAPTLSAASGDHGGGVVVVHHVAAVGGGVGAAAGRRRAPLVLYLQPRLAQRLGEVVVHGARDGHRVGGGRLRFLVVLPQAAAEVLLDHRVAGRVGWEGVGETRRSEFDFELKW